MSGDLTKYSRYQDNVIKNGRLVGEFDVMYRDFDDPWSQTETGLNTKRSIILHHIKRTSAKKVLELGSGLGYLTNEINNLVVDVLGLEISQTAVQKASLRFPNCRFVVGDILDQNIYNDFLPDMVLMPEITWYVLDKLDDFVSMLRDNFNGIYLLHALTVYPPGIQEYGLEKFTSLDEIMKFFQFEYIEWGQINHGDSTGSHTYFLGRVI